MSDQPAALAFAREVPRPSAPEPPAPSPDTRDTATAGGPSPRLRAAAGFFSTVGVVTATLGVLMLVVRVLPIAVGEREPWRAWLAWWLPANAIAVGAMWAGRGLLARRRSGFVVGAAVVGTLLLESLVTGDRPSPIDTGIGVLGALALFVAWRERS